MTAKNSPKTDIGPVIKITLVNYEPRMQDTYDKKFMVPLIEGLLKRMQNSPTPAQ